jgi:hypothetical protein
MKPWLENIKCSLEILLRYGCVNAPTIKPRQHRGLRKRLWRKRGRGHVIVPTLAQRTRLIPYSLAFTLVDMAKAREQKSMLEMV